jgi:hypothetical protein
MSTPVQSFSGKAKQEKAGVPETIIRARMVHVTSKLAERYFDPGADNGAGTGAVGSLLGVKALAAETPADTTRAVYNGGLTLDDDRLFGPTSEMLVALPERSSNIGETCRGSE